MVMTTGLLDLADSENELAFVLAHELGHHQLRHPSQGLGRSLLLLMGLSILGLGQQTSPVIDPSAPLTLADMQFSRKQEQASDRFALKLVQQRYGHIDHALDFFYRLRDPRFDSIARDLQLEFFTTHPFPETRIEDLEAYARRKGWSLTGDSVPLTLATDE